MTLSIMHSADAKTLPQVDWGNEIYTMNIPDSAKNAAVRRRYQLLNAGTPEANRANKNKIVDAINEKLNQQSSQLRTAQNAEIDINADLTAAAGEAKIAISGDWAENPSTGLYALQMTSSHADERTVQTAKNVDHPITLNVTGMGEKEVETKQHSEVNGFKIYKVWLESTIDGVTREVTNDITEEFLRDPRRSHSVHDESRE